MIVHAMKVIRSAVQHVNPSQTPVLAADQPLFALAKQIQWALGDAYSEDQFVVMLGGLHIEMAAFKALGKWLTAGRQRSFAMQEWQHKAWLIHS